jgi:hypothetical protein
MARHPKVQLSRLRDIGFRDWDPIGVLVAGEPWKDHPAADEYDRYLLELVRRLVDGAGEAEAVDFLIWIESDHMGLGAKATTEDRAAATVRSIRAYLDGLPDDATDRGPPGSGSAI